MYGGKPIIGIIGGIGSGKSFVARLFGEMGCLVINSDEQVRRAYSEPEVQSALRDRWGDGVFNSPGEVNRKAIAARVFERPDERKWLESLVHPVIARERDAMMAAKADDAQVVAFVWDAPLLLEVGLDRFCDAIVFVEAPEQMRMQRVAAERGWKPAELVRREKSQWPLDKKRQMSDYIASNTAGADQVRIQVRRVLSQILAGTKRAARQDEPPAKEGTTP